MFLLLLDCSHNFRRIFNYQICFDGHGKVLTLLVSTAQAPVCKLLKPISHDGAR